MKERGRRISITSEWNRNGESVAFEEHGLEHTLGSVTPLVWTKMTLCMNLIAAILTPEGVC